MIKLRAIMSGCLVVAAQIAIGSPVFAGPGEDAAVLKGKADEAFDGRRFTEALERYEEALKKNRDARLHYNIAQALAALERYPEALGAYQAFIAEAPAGILNEAQQAKLFAFVEKLKGTIARVDLTCDVIGARVLVRGKVVGSTPLSAPVVVNHGIAKIEAIADGYKPFEATLALTGGTTHPVQITLERVDFTGVVAVRSNVAGAQVSVDGVQSGLAPMEVRLERGAHVVEVSAGDHVRQSKVVTVEEGKRAELTVTLERAPSYTIAYVGAGLGAVGLVAGTVTGVLALSSFGKAKELCDVAMKQCGPAGQSDLQASRTWGTLSTVAFGVGVAGIGIGAYGLLTAKPGGQRRKVDVAVYPGGVGLLGTF